MKTKGKKKVKDDGWFWHPAPNPPCVFWMSHRLERDSAARRSRHRSQCCGGTLVGSWDP